VTGPDPVRAELDELAAALRRRDRDALTRCYQLTADLLMSVALGMLRDPEEAQEAVQDAFVSFVRNAHTITGDGRSIRAWLVQAVRSRSIDRTRTAARRREVPSDDLPEQPTAEEIEVSLGASDPAFERAFHGLTEAQRTAMVLYHVHGLSGNETAAAMGSNRAAVYTLLRRAEATMRRQLAPDPSDPPTTERLGRRGGE
jgi:RNA polymerase sigma-70 factor (ECF subfamily)